MPSTELSEWMAYFEIKAEIEEKELKKSMQGIKKPKRRRF